MGCGPHRIPRGVQGLAVRRIWWWLFVKAGLKSPLEDFSDFGMASIFAFVRPDSSDEVVILHLTICSRLEDFELFVRLVRTYSEGPFQKSRTVSLTYSMRRPSNGKWKMKSMLKWRKSPTTECKYSMLSLEMPGNVWFYVSAFSHALSFCIFAFRFAIRSALSFCNKLFLHMLCAVSKVGSLPSGANGASQFWLLGGFCTRRNEHVRWVRRKLSRYD